MQELERVNEAAEVIPYNNFEELDRELQNELEREAEGFVKIGYMLKIFRDTKILEDTQYKDVNDYAMRRFHLDKSQVSRFTRINDRFSEGGYSDKLQDRFKGLGYAKLSLMLMLPEAIADEITPAFSKSEVQEIKEEFDEEKKITDIEVMLEGTDNRQEHIQTNLQKVLWQLLHDDTDLFQCIHEWRKEKLQYKETMEKLHDILAPQEEAIYSVRLQGIGKMMLSVKELGKAVTLVNARSGEKESYTWDELNGMIEELVQAKDGYKAEWEELYKEIWPKMEVAPVQQIPKPVPVSKNEKKSEPRKQSKVNKVVPQKKETQLQEEKKEEKHEVLPGQTTVSDLPNVTPEGYKESVSENEENKDVVKGIEENSNMSEEEKEKRDRYKRDYFLTIAEANNALHDQKYDTTIKHLDTAKEIAAKLKELSEKGN